MEGNEHSFLDITWLEERNLKCPICMSPYRNLPVKYWPAAILHLDPEKSNDFCIMHLDQLALYLLERQAKYQKYLNKENT